jgi:NitT/TauT family transport system substrate-binding protein
MPRWIALPPSAALLFAALLFGATPGVAETLHVGTVGVVSDAPFFIADKQGFFHDEGLDVDFIRFDSAAKMIAPLGAGELDAGGGATSAALFNAAKRSVNIRIVADKARNSPGYGFQAILVRKDLFDSGKIRSFADLKGAKIAVSAKGNSEEFILGYALQKGGVALSDIEEVYLGFPQHPVAYANQAIDASLTTEPTTSFIEAAGTAVKLAGVDAFYPEYQTAVIYYGADFISKKPEAARKFMRALIRGIRFYRDGLKNGHLAGPNGEKIVQIMTEYGTVKDPAVYRNSIASGIDANGVVNLASLKATWQFFRDTKQIDGSVSVDDVMDTSFATQAVKELGPYQPAQ